MHNGQVRLVQMLRNGRPGLLRRLGTVDDVHLGRVTAIALPQGRQPSTLLMTCAADGGIKLWDLDRPHRQECVWTTSWLVNAAEPGDSAEMVTLLVPRIGEVVIAVATRLGTVRFWRRAIDGGHTLDEKTTIFQRPDPPQEVSYMALDQDSTGKLSALIHYREQSHFLRVSPFEPGQPRAVFGHLDDRLGAITCFRSAFDVPRQHLPLPRSPARRSEPDAVPEPSETERTPSGLSLAFEAKDQHPTDDIGYRKFVVAADAQGRVFVWDWDSPPTTDSAILPIRHVQSFEARVTALEISEFLIFVGT
jgi:WD40 repeat protein